ncbi:hypothetical protein, partial [Nostoc linckia]|uniref:hypothetical protein n=1 Tax=Nostoc linckia TaxID=92942 RepID=UPI00211E494E
MGRRGDGEMGGMGDGEKIFPMPNAQCPMPNAPCPMPNPLCAIICWLVLLACSVSLVNTSFDRSTKDFI